MSDSSVVVAFEGGLDLVTPVQNSAPGTLVDSLNYEVGPIKGYRRVDGYSKFDNGRVGCGATVLLTSYMTPVSSFGITPGDILVYTGDGDNLDIVVGFVVENRGGMVIYVGLHPKANMHETLTPGRYTVRRYSGDNIVASSKLASFTASVSYSSLPGVTPENNLDMVRAAQQLQSIYVSAAPAPISGAYYGHSEAYAVLDCLGLRFTAPNMLKEGWFVRLNGWPYRVARLWRGTYFLVRIAGTNDGSSGLTNVFGVPITGFTIDNSPIGKFYGQPHLMEGGYVPIEPGMVVEYNQGAQAFPSVVRVRGTTSADWTEHKVVDYTVTSGSFDDGNATGLLYLGKVDVRSNSFDGHYPVGAEIVSATGTLLANNAFTLIPLWAGTGAVRPNVEDPTQTFYQWATYNFKATEGSEMVFAANGRTRAGFILRHQGDLLFNVITTGTSFDRPRYIAFHAEQRLVVAFSTGSLQLSAVGNPLNFSGLEGAIEIGNGDNITGLLEASGDSTLVFGPRSIRRLVGKGAQIGLNTVSSASGAMDYTACIVSGTPVYVNRNGVCVLEQTSAYGDFANSAVSGKVDPWLTPRLVMGISSPDLGGALCAFPVRSKNQYRLFLGDGQVLNLSLTVDGPQPMRCSYNKPSGALRLPLAYSSSVSDIGDEYLLVVWDADKSAALVPNPDNPWENIVYRLDCGWGFDLETFDHYIESAYLFNKDPQFLTVDKAVLYGMTYGVASLRLRAFGVEDSFSGEFDTTVQDISLPRNPRLLERSLGRDIGIVDHANWGRAIKLRFEGLHPAGGADTEPPHILQSVRLFVQTDGIPEN